MFTGIIKGTGIVAGREPRGGDVRLAIDSEDLPWSEYAVGDSISVSGACLTVAVLRETGFDADVSVETLDVTTLGSFKPGTRVNLEPAMAVGDRLGGHLVSGHVDCIGHVTGLVSDARSIRLSIEIPKPFARYVARKGSVCVDGVSLTINEVSGNHFELNIIPHTADATTIGQYAVGCHVNIEVDQLARYLERLISHDGSKLTVEFLRANGYA